MRAMLLRVGIDQGTDGVLAPIFEDGTFEYIPMSEIDPRSSEDRPYENTMGRSGRRDYEKFKEDYLEKRSKEKAYDAAIEEFKRKKGVKKLDEFRQ